MSETDELLAGYEECRERLVVAIVAGLNHAKPTIEQSFAAENHSPFHAESPALNVT